MVKDAHRKLATEATPSSTSAMGQAHFNKPDFDATIWDKGHNIYLEKALKCPCRNAASKSGLPDCQNCRGIGWVFINKRDTRAIVQAMNRQEKGGKRWTEEDRGTMSITLRDDDRIAFMDRITMREMQANYSEVLKLKKEGSKWVGRTIYPMIAVEFVFMFEKSDKPLYKLTSSDYSINENYVSVNLALENVEEPSITVRYFHNPQFHIIDITRDQFLHRGGLPPNCDIQQPVSQELAKLPVHAVARRAHYILDTPDMFGDSVFNNSVAS